MDIFSIFTSITLYILTLYIIYFLIRFVIDLIKQALLSDKSVDYGKTLYGNI